MPGLSGLSHHSRERSIRPLLASGAATDLDRTWLWRLAFGAAAVTAATALASAFSVGLPTALTLPLPFEAPLSLPAMPVSSA